jgi:ribosomal protein S18 acetylase RimI-like enzyme
MSTITQNGICLITAGVMNVDLFWSSSCVIEVAYATKGYFPERKGLWKILHLTGLAAKSFASTFKKKATTIVAFEGKKAVGTLCVYQDNGKLPIENLFPEALKKLREDGLKMVYIGTFATSDEFRGKAKVAASLFQEAVKLGREAMATQALCVVNPDHVRFYRRLGFTEIAQCENMTGLNNAVAVLMKLDGRILKNEVIERMANM